MKRLLVWAFTLVLATVAKAQTNTQGVPVCYASYYGNDSQDGLTLATAKKNIMKCYDALPSTGGSIYIVSGNGAGATPVPADDTIANAHCGIWIMGQQMGAGDPNYNNLRYFTPNGCWRKAKNGAVAFLGWTQGVYGNNGHVGGAAMSCGSNIDNAHPCIWLSSIARGVDFYNLEYQYPGTGIKIGTNSSNVKDDNAGVASVLLRGVIGQVSDTAGLGPNVDIGPNTFWIYIEDSAFNGTTDKNGNTDATHYLGSAINIDPAGRSSASFVYIRNSHLQHGGIRFITGSTGAFIVVEDTGSESQDRGDQAVFIGRNGGATPAAYINGVSVSDSKGAVPAVRVDSSTVRNGSAICVLRSGGYLTDVVGPATIGTCDVAANSPNLTGLLLSEGQTGISRGRSFIQEDSARRSGGPVVIRWPNKAKQLPSQWMAGGDVKITPGQADPFGGMNAGLVTTTSSSATGAVFAYPSQALSVGDVFIGAAWSASTTRNGYVSRAPLSITLPTNPGVFECNHTGQNYVSSDFPWKGDGEWDWTYVVCTVTAVGTSRPVNVSFRGNVQGARDAPLYSANFYAPIFIHVPASSGVSRNEVLEYARTLSAGYPDNISTPGTVATLQGQDFAVSGGNLSVSGKITVGSGTSGVSWSTGKGAPSMPCTTGSLYTRSDGRTGTTLYVCEDGFWAAK